MICGTACSSQRRLGIAEPRTSSACCRFCSTYLGHSDLEGTKVYLTMTPELLQQASLRFEQFAQKGSARMTDREILGPWLRRFLVEYIVTERNLAQNTRSSYRDTFSIICCPMSAKTSTSLSDG